MPYILCGVPSQHCWVPNTNTKIFFFLFRLKEQSSPGLQLQRRSEIHTSSFVVCNLVGGWVADIIHMLCVVYILCCFLSEK